VRVRGSWIAAGLFFLAGSFLVAVPSIARFALFAALWGARVSFDHSMVEAQVPTFLNGFAGVAFALSAIALVGPSVRRMIARKADSPEE